MTIGTVFCIDPDKAIGDMAQVGIPCHNAALAPSPLKEIHMSVSTKKLIGTIILLVCLGIYAMFCLIIGIALIPHVWWAELPYYAFVGIVWAFPAKYLIVWMSSEPKD